jgi:hypothetical protein
VPAFRNGAVGERLSNGCQSGAGARPATIDYVEHLEGEP